MKSMDEFQSVVVLAALVLGACALIDLPLTAPGPAPTIAGSGSPTKMQIHLPSQLRASR